MDGTFRFNSKISASPTGAAVSPGGTSIGGSMARFGIKDDVLYLVDNSTLRLLDISSKSAPVKFLELNAGWGIETLFMTEENMFMGINTGMLIYDISDPRSPQFVSSYNHVRSCDPVVVDDTLAYVTLRTGTNCGGSANTLDVVTISEISSPVMLTSYDMTNPHGLGKDGDILFVCDGDAGLKVYDASDPLAISENLKYSYPNIKTSDVILLGGILILIGEDGLYQYDYSNIQKINLLSRISVKNE